MHTDVDYSRYQTKEEQEEAALADCKNWFGSKYDDIVDTLQHLDPEVTYNQLLFQFAFSGVKGYPARVMIERYTKLRKPIDTIRVDLTQ